MSKTSDQSPGYYRYPTIHGDTIVFVCEDDLWAVPVDGGAARRLTSNFGPCLWPRFSPDGKQLAFIGREEGPGEVYVMPGRGGEARRLTHQAAGASVAGWTEDGREIVYASNFGEQCRRTMALWSVSPHGGQPREWRYGPATLISFGPKGAKVLGRHAADPSRWKRYRGGTAGRLWIDVEGTEEFKPLEPAEGNFTSPMWIGSRIYFISDHEGIGNLYSCRPNGTDLKRHTHHEDFYCRNASTDGKRIVYHAGADLYVLDVKTGESRLAPVDFRSPRMLRQRKFVSASKYLQGASLRPDGEAVCLTVRGKPFTMANWEGAVRQHGVRDGVRYRLTAWLNDGQRLVTIADSSGEERIEIHWRAGTRRPKRLMGLDIGQAYGMTVSPKKDEVAICNHRLELLLVDLKTGKMKQIDKSPYESIHGMSWSPDGRWLAYAFASTERTCSIKVCHVATGKSQFVTRAEFSDVSPSWDPEGKYLYFLSFRDFNPVYDHVHFDLSFVEAGRPFLVTLRRDLPNPFVPQPKEQDGDENGDGKDGDKKDKKEEEAKPVQIDFEGIEQRICAFPVKAGRYGQISGIKGKALYTVFPTAGALSADPTDKGTIYAYAFKDQKAEALAKEASGFTLSRDRKMLLYFSKGKVRVVKAGEKPNDKAGDRGSRETGWLDLGRVRASVVPLAEWRQMYREAWRLQRDHFWTEDMSGVDWQRVYERYLPLVERVATRGEFSDLMWEMQGELGTSHAYEMGGDYRPAPNYGQGSLGADFAFDERAGGYRVVRIAQGDAWEPAKDSPFNEPGVNVRVGDVLMAIGGQRLSQEATPNAMLVGLAGQEVDLTVRPKGRAKPRTVTVKVLSDETELHYRDWVRRNREYVHKKTRGKVGYVHIPDMSGRGYAEFHRGYLAELDHPGMIVDVRGNGGGHVSPLILEKLARRRIGYDVQRHGQPIPYPEDSVMGPMVAVTDELAGSDGDIFSHCFKLMKLGTLIGKRTWGGVVGISPRLSFVDGGTTTQPEYSFWFEDVGWDVENYGTDPDIEVEYRPQDYLAGVDPQLDRAIEVILEQMKANPPKLPDFGKRPKRTLPKLPGGGERTTKVTKGEVR